MHIHKNWIFIRKNTDFFLAFYFANEKNWSVLYLLYQRSHNQINFKTSKLFQRPTSKYLLTEKRAERLYIYVWEILVFYILRFIIGHPKAKSKNNFWVIISYVFKVALYVNMNQTCQWINSRHCAKLVNFIYETSKLNIDSDYSLVAFTMLL